MHDRAPRPIRGSFQLLIDPVFGPFLLSKVMSTTGIWIYNIVAAILAYELTRSTFVVGLVSVAQFLPQLLLAPLSGALADRADRRLQLAVGRLTSALGAGGLALWVGLAGVEGLPGPAPVIGAALIVGTGFMVGGPATDALLPTLVRREELAAAIALHSMPATFARAAGPAIGALIAARAGPVVALSVGALANLGTVLIVLWLPIGGRAARTKGVDPSMWAGVRHVRADPTLLLLLIGVTAVGIGADPAITLSPRLADELGRGSQFVGVLASSFGVGAGAVFIVLRMLQRRLGLPRLGPAGLGLVSTGMLTLAVADWPWTAALGFGIAGAGMTVALTSLTTQMQQRLPDALRGRVMALWWVAFMGSRPAAAAINGAVADAFGPQSALVLVAVVVALGAWMCRPSRLRPSPRT